MILPWVGVDESYEMCICGRQCLRSTSADSGKQAGMLSTPVGLKRCWMAINRACWPGMCSRCILVLSDVRVVSA